MGGVSQVGVVVMRRPVDPAPGLLVMSETRVLRSHTRGLHIVVVIDVVVVAADAGFHALRSLGVVLPGPGGLTLSMMPLVDLQLPLDLLPLDLVHLRRSPGVLRVTHQPVCVAGQGPVIGLQILSLNESL